MKKYMGIILAMVVFCFLGVNAIACDDPPCDGPYDQETKGESELSDSHNWGGQETGSYVSAVGLSTYDAKGKLKADGTANVRLTAQPTTVETDDVVVNNLESQLSLSASTDQDVGPAIVTNDGDLNSGAWANKLDDDHYGYSGNETGGLVSVKETNPCNPVKLDTTIKTSNNNTIKYSATPDGNTKELNVATAGIIRIDPETTPQEKSVNVLGNYGGGLLGEVGRGEFSGSFETEKNALKAMGTGTGKIIINRVFFPTGGFESSVHATSKSQVD